MKRLSLSEWEKKYVHGPVERFDQKNVMFIRPLWDPEVRSRLKNWSYLGEISDKPGYALRDLALRRAARIGTQLTRFNTSKPNPSRLAKEVERAVAQAMAVNTPEGTPSGGNAAVLRVPEEVKAAYVSDQRIVTRDIKKAAVYFGADLVGICRLDRRWVYSHTPDVDGGGTGPVEGQPVMDVESEPQEIPDDFQFAVVTAFAEDYNMLKYYPSWIAHAATSMGYSMMAITNMFLSAFVRSLGFKVIDCSINAVVLSIPLAMQAGLGELGRNGLLITPQYGPRVRINVLITDLPLVPDSPIEFGVSEFCTACEKCAKTCPSQSILRGNRTTKPRNVSNSGGVLKWPIDAETCRMYWGRANRPCTTCIASCPYAKPTTLFHRAVLWFTDYARWADPFYVKMDDLLGYGKPNRPDNFWEEWRPVRQER